MNLACQVETFLSLTGLLLTAFRWSDVTLWVYTRQLHAEYTFLIWVCIHVKLISFDGLIWKLVSQVCKPRVFWTPLNGLRQQTTLWLDYLTFCVVCATWVKT